LVFFARPTSEERSGSVFFMQAAHSFHFLRREETTGNLVTGKVVLYVLNINADFKIVDEGIDRLHVRMRGVETQPAVAVLAG